MEPINDHKRTKNTFLKLKGFLRPVVICLCVLIFSAISFLQVDWTSNAAYFVAAPAFKVVPSFLSKTLQEGRPDDINQTLRVLNQKELKKIRMKSLSDPLAILLSQEKTPQFDPRFKNPCWWTDTMGNHSLTCLPYFYLGGFPKSGTTDLFSRLMGHPMIVMPLAKEPHFISRGVFKQNIHCGRMMLQKAHASCKTYMYADRFFNHAVDPIQTNITGKFPTSAFVSKPVGNFKYPFITVDASASTGWDNEYGHHIYRDISLPENVYRDKPRIWDWILKINPNVRLLLIIREPISRTYSAYNFFNKNTTAAEFDKLVREEILFFENCSRNTGLRHTECAYKRKKMYVNLRVHVSIYHEYITNILERIPRSRIHVVRTEDYQTNMAEHLQDIFTFLDLPKLKPEEIQKLLVKDMRNVNRRQIDPIWNSTREKLENFYKPHNQKLAKLLNNDAFLWQDVYNRQKS